MSEANDQEGDESEKHRWWVRIAITLIIVLTITCTVLFSVIYRRKSMPQRSSVYIIREEDEEIIANRMLAEEYKNTQSFSEPNISGMAVFSEHPFCAEIGSKVLSDGGSAVDAGIAMLFCQGVVEPHHSGLGGGMLMTIYIREKKEIVVLDAQTVAPLFTTPSMFANNSSTSRLGWSTIAVPGEGLGLWEAHKKYGKLKWQRLIDPAIRLASHGFPVSYNLAKYLVRYNETVHNNPYLSKVFVNPSTNNTYKEGDDVLNEDLAKVLIRVAKDGVHHLYRGNGAATIANESRKCGDVLEEHDFNKYEVRWSYPLQHVFRNLNDKAFTLYMPPPPSCAIMIGMILNIVKMYEEGAPGLDDYSPNRIARFYHRIVEAMKHSFAKKNLFGDSSETPITEIDEFLSPHWGRAIRKLMSPTKTFRPELYTKDVSTKIMNHQDIGTANVGAVASNGDAMVASSSLNDPFGSGIVSESLGFLLNNNMLSFSKRKNGFGNVILAGKRALTSLCPVIILDDQDRFKLLIAGAGGTRIPTSIALILMRYFWLQKDITEATRQFRFHHQLVPNYVLYEGNSREYTLLEYLREYGHEIIITDNDWPHINSIILENGTIRSVLDARENV